jgi:leucyl aminopeptidase (aminopeptidase T)
MTDHRIATMADILSSTYSLQVKSVTSCGSRAIYIAEPLILASTSAVSPGAHPFIHAQLPQAEPIFYRLATDHQPDFLRELERRKKEEERVTRLVEWMRPRNEVHIEADGTSLTLELGRTYIPTQADTTFPDGEFFAGPKANGTPRVLIPGAAARRVAA